MWKRRKARETNNVQWHEEQPVDEIQTNDLSEGEDAPAYELAPRMAKKWHVLEQQATELPIKTLSGDLLQRQIQSSKDTLGGPPHKKIRKTLSLADGKSHDDGGQTDEDEALVREKITRREKRIVEDARKQEQRFLRKRLIGRTKPLSQYDIQKKKSSELLITAQTPHDKMIVISELAQQLMTNPEEQLHIFEVLYEFYEEEPRDSALRTVTLLTMGVMFKDTLPGYRIKTATDDGGDDELAPDGRKFSNKVKNIRTFERSFLKLYEKFIKIIKIQVKVTPVVTIPLVCELLQTSPSFNYHKEELLPICVKYTGRYVNNVHEEDTRSVALRYKCLSCLQTLLENDSSLDIAKEITAAVGLWAKVSHGTILSQHSKNRQMDSNASTNKETGRSSCLQLNGQLLDVISNIDFPSKEFVAETESLSYADEKKHLDEETLRQWRASRVNPELQQYRRNEATVLREVFVIFLRILKSAEMYSIGVLEGALKGLGRLTLRVNAELVNEILSELRSLLSKKTQPEPTVALLAIASALKLLYAEGAALQVDVSWICEALTRVLHQSLPLMSCGATSTSAGHTLNSFTKCNPETHLLPEDADRCTAAAERLPPNGSSDSLTSNLFLTGGFPCALLECVDLLLGCRQIIGQGAAAQHSLNNWISFVTLTKALMDITVHADSSVATAVCRKVVTFFRRFPRLKALVDTDGAIVSSLSEEVSLFWQLELLNCQLDPRLPTLVTALSCFASDWQCVVNRLASSNSTLGNRSQKWATHSEAHESLMQIVTDLHHRLQHTVVAANPTGIMSTAADFAALVGLESNHELSEAALQSRKETLPRGFRGLFAPAAEAFIAEGGASASKKSLPLRLENIVNLSQLASQGKIISQK